MEIQNGVVAITVVHVDRDQHHNFSKYTYEYYTKREFSITLIVVLDAYKENYIIAWLNSSANAFFLLAKFESPSWRWRMSRQNRPIKLKILRSVVIFALFLRSIFFNFHFIRSQNDKKCRYNTKLCFMYRSQ